MTAYVRWYITSQHVLLTNCYRMFKHMGNLGELFLFNLHFDKNVNVSHRDRCIDYLMIKNLDVRLEV